MDHSSHLFLLLNLLRHASDGNVSTAFVYFALWNLNMQIANYYLMNNYQLIN